MMRHIRAEAHKHINDIWRTLSDRWIPSGSRAGAS